MTSFGNQVGGELIKGGEVVSLGGPAPPPPSPYMKPSQMGI